MPCLFVVCLFVCLFVFRFLSFSSCICILKYLFIWGCQVLVTACWLGSCGVWTQLCQGMWDLSSPTRDGNHAPCTGRRILNPQSTRKVLSLEQELVKWELPWGCCLHYRIRTVFAEVASQGEMSVLSIILMTWLSPPPPPKHGKGGASKCLGEKAVVSDECQRRLCEEATFE